MREKPSRQLSGLQTHEGTTAEEEVIERTQNYKENFTTPGVSAAALRGSIEQGQRHQARQVPVAGPFATEKSSLPIPVQQQKKKRPVSLGSKCKQ
jgi:hypothetical protein